MLNRKYLRLSILLPALFVFCFLILSILEKTPINSCIASQLLFVCIGKITYIKEYFSFPGFLTLFLTSQLLKTDLLDDLRFFMMTIGYAVTLTEIVMLGFVLDKILGLFRNIFQNHKVAHNP